MSRKLNDNVMIRARQKQVAYWKAAAAQEEISLSEFLRKAADDHAQDRLAQMSGPGRVHAGENQ